MRERYPERVDAVAIVLGALRASLFLALIALALPAASPVRADVSTSRSGSTLVVSGDESADRIEIGSASDGVSVVGLDGTLVDGSSAGVTVPGVERLTVKLGRGENRLTIRQLRLTGRLDVRAGRGSDRIVLDDVRAGSTRIATGDGDDRVTIDDSRLRRLVVDTGNGDDAVLLDTVWVPGDVHVFTGGDDDVVEIVDTEVDDDVHVHLGDGDDDVVLQDVEFKEDTHLDGEDGDDEALIDDDSRFGGDVDLDGFGDDDWWWWFSL